jgi:signal recognition particle subunit SRP54
MGGGVPQPTPEQIAEMQKSMAGGKLPEMPKGLGLPPPGGLPGLGGRPMLPGLGGKPPFPPGFNRFGVKKK